MKKYLLLLGVFLFVGFTSLQAQINVTFKVDMSRWQELGKFNPAVDEVKCVGDVSPNSWDPAANTGMTRTGGSGADSSVYTVTYAINPSASFAYKYAIGSDWNRDEKDLGGDGNRHLVTGTVDSTLATVWFDNISGGYRHVTFKVDMALPIKQGVVTPGVTKVYLAGSFTDWQTSAREMTKSSTDSTYSYMTVVPDDSVASGDTVQFKYVYSASDAASGTWESVDNRKFFVPEADSSNFSAYWNDTNPNITLGSGNITFQVDMSVMSEIGIFDNTRDSVEVRGAFNGWGDADPTNSRLNQNFSNPDSWFLAVPFNNVEVGGKQEFKFYVINKSTGTVDTLWKDGYERPIQQGGNNWNFLFPGKDTTVSKMYDGIQTDWVIPSGTNLSAKFSVDMTDAMDAAKQAIPFNPATDTLYWICEQPAFTRSQEWVDSDNMKVLMMTQVGSSNIWSGTLAVTSPAFNAFEYRYGWVSSGSWTLENGALGVNDTYRRRFIGQDAARSFPVNPWTMPTDTWTPGDVKTDLEVDPYQSYNDFTGLKQEKVQPLTYSLDQNYPNPFNPSTNIRFSIQKAGLVSLKIYNVLGQEVTTLLNGELSAGTYTYSFDASRLSSGIYFYTIHSNNFVQTKKMILLK